jgi:hypothetical protein
MSGGLNLSLRVGAAQQGPRLGPAIQTAFQGDLFPLQEPIDSAGADANKQLSLCLGKTIAGLDPRKPSLEDGLQANRPGEAGLKPDALNHVKELAGVELLAPRSFLRNLITFESLPMDFGDGILAVEMTDAAEFVEDSALLLFTGLKIAFFDGFDVSHAELPGHAQPPGLEAQRVA